MLRNKISESRLTMAVSHSHLEERIAMFKSIQKSGRIAAVAIGLIAALSPLAAPPAALASGSVPTPELEKSYSFKTSSDHSNVSKVDTGSGYCYLFDRDDEYNLKKVSLINLDDGSITPVDIPKKSLDSACSSIDDKLTWIEGSNLVVFSPEKQSRSVHSLKAGKYTPDYAWISENGETACVIQHDSDDNYSHAFYDLKTDKEMQLYRDSDYSWVAFSKDGDCFYVVSTDAKKCTITLKVFDTKTGSTKSNTAKVNKVTDSVEINSVLRLPDSEDLILQGKSFLIRADRDANLSTLSNDEDHAFNTDNSSLGTSGYYPVYLSNGSEDLFQEEDDGSYFLNMQDSDLGVIDLQSGNTISSIAFPFGDGYLSDISHDGSILLGKYSDDDKFSMCLIDAKTGAKSEFNSHWCSLYFINGDRKILAAYSEKDDPTTLHVNIYKSNIPHSLPEDVLYFVQTHLPFVIGGGAAIVLIIGGAIVVLCIRKKRAKTANGTTAAVPKPQRKQRRRQKRAQQNVVAPTAPAMPTAPAAPTEPARFCRHCGTPLAPEAQFCPTCGQKVD